MKMSSTIRGGVARVGRWCKAKTDRVSAFVAIPSWMGFDLFLSDTKLS